MLPTLPRSSLDHRAPPLRPDSGTIYRGGLILRGLMAGLLFWVSIQFPHSTWNHAWMVAAGLALVDGVAALIVLRWPDGIPRMIPYTVVADGLIGWGVAWAYSQSPHTLVPGLLTLYTHEILTYYPNRRGAVFAGLYIIVTNSLLGIVPGVHAAPLWPWSVVVYWMVVDALIWGAFLMPLHFPLRPRTVALLTEREREIYYLLVAGWSAAQIAESLHIDAGTVRSHVAHIHHKLGRSPL